MGPKASRNEEPFVGAFVAHGRDLEHGIEPTRLANGERRADHARRFRRAWGSRRALDQVAQAVARQPVNPGPLNSHVLVLRTLAQMRALSPDYLQHFLVHVKGLQALERALEKAPRVAAKKASPRRKA